jgi:hypothetical protein
MVSPQSVRAVIAPKSKELLVARGRNGGMLGHDGLAAAGVVGDRFCRRRIALFKQVAASEVRFSARDTLRLPTGASNRTRKFHHISRPQRAARGSSRQNAMMALANPNSLN